ncbi:cell division protein FtsL [Ketogulonicigenium vulgare]|uniref:Putative FtsL n=1 Tax=Ketogulonicigenium vulgare (strain WSH-001) TaxID=759362 RepID=F9Y989_KETVW|nr:cell division protein FtsL [Ketogulonicigenium vulgare]ADO41567.1 conserved hypothetical protein [Ketogulonicigenium vulgare Y25]AEM41306.1 putative FtsL [Ketogulonicigenium vulgare WSH-001]ALJ81443.1 cell division protein FtsL [Ketogulonicigenium vulgare]ANW34162.1 cell division protein FtsL [Ketogulonicigenium vulgare]AOZ55042.1 hypothetical protein KVC_2035 [Ketogulonicigenium vulgare]
MRALLNIAIALFVMGLAFWAYRENYQTQAAQREVNSLRNQIAATHSRNTMLRAEWAYLNRPDRLSELVALNFGELGLLPMMPETFGRIDTIPFPPPTVQPTPQPGGFDILPEANVTEAILP